MRRTTLVLAILVLAAVFAAASQSQAAGSYTTTDVASANVIGSGFKTFDHAGIQKELGHEFYKDIWASVWGLIPFSFQDIGKNLGTEVDLNGWYNVNENLKFGVSYFFISPDLWAKRNDIWQVNGEFSKAFPFGDATVSPGFRVEYDFPADGSHNSRNTGLYLIPMVGLGYTVNEHLNVSVNTKFTYDTGGYGAEKALIIKLAPRVIYHFSKQFSANVGMDIYIPTFTTSDEVRTNQYVPRFGISREF